MRSSEKESGEKMISMDDAIRKIWNRMNAEGKKLVLDKGYNYKVECNVSRDECFSHHCGDENDGCWDCPQFQKILDKLFRYESIDPEPENIEKILDAYGRGMTLRTETALRLGTIKDIPTLELDKLVELYYKRNVEKTTVCGNPDIPKDVLDEVWNAMLAK